MLIAAEKVALGVKVMVMNTCEPIAEEDLKKISSRVFCIHKKPPAARASALP